MHRTCTGTLVRALTRDQRFERQRLSMIPRTPATDRTRKRSTVTCFEALVRPLLVPITLLPLPLSPPGLALLGRGAYTRRTTDFALPQRGLPPDRVRLAIAWPATTTAAGRFLSPIEQPFTKRFGADGGPNE